MTYPALSVEWVGGWLSPCLLGPWGGVFVVLLGPLYISLHPSLLRGAVGWLGTAVGKR